MILAVFVLFLSIPSFLLYHIWWKRRSYPPGPVPIPLLGNLHQLDPVFPHETLTAWGKKYGPVYTVWFGPSPVLILNGYKTLKDTLVKQADVFSARPVQFTHHHLTQGKNGVIVSDGEGWKEQRRFAMHALRDFGLGRNAIETKILEETEKLVSFLRDQMDKGGRDTSVDAEGPIELCIGNVIASMVFGHTYERDDPVFWQHISWIDSSYKVFSQPGVLFLDAYPWMRYLPIPGRLGYTSVKKHAEEYWGLVGKEIQSHKDTFDENAEPRDFIDAYLKEMKRRENAGDIGSFSEVQLGVTIRDLWIAGVETTVTSLRWAFLLMLHHPEVQTRVQEELDSVVGPFRSVIMGDKPSLPYTNAVLQEIQRKANVVSINLQHVTTQDTTIADYHVPQGTAVLPQIYSVHVDSTAYPDPDRFDPLRFLEADGKTPKKVEELAPFSMGKRTCMGESLARMELFLVFANLLHNFKLSSPSSGLPTLTPIYRGNLCPQKYEVTLSARNRFIM